MSILAGFRILFFLALRELLSIVKIILSQKISKDFLNGAVLSCLPACWRGHIYDPKYLPIVNPEPKYLTHTHTHQHHHHQTPDNTPQPHRQNAPPRPPRQGLHLLHNLHHLILFHLFHRQLRVLPALLAAKTPQRPLHAPVAACEFGH